MTLSAPHLIWPQVQLVASLIQQQQLHLMHLAASRHLTANEGVVSGVCKAACTQHSVCRQRLCFLPSKLCAVLSQMLALLPTPEESTRRDTASRLRQALQLPDSGDSADQRW